MPTVIVPKLMLVRDRLTIVPVPLSGTDCGFPGALSVKVKEPFRTPAAVGVNFTLTVQLRPALRVLPQVLAEMEKSPVIPMLFMFSVALPVFVTVTVFAALVVFTSRNEKVSEVGEKLTCGAPPETPVPDNPAVCWPPGASSVTVSVPFCWPVAVGVKVIWIVQLPPGSTMAPGRVPQFCDETANSAVVWMLLIVRFLAWLLVSTIGIGALVVLIV